MKCLGRVFSKLGYNVSDDILQKIAENKPHFVEYLLINLKIKIERYLEQQEYDDDDDDHMQPHPMTTLYKQGPSEAYHHQEEYRHHPIAAPLNSNKSNSYQTGYLAEGEAYHGGSHQQPVTGTRPSQLPVPNHKLTSHSYSGAQYNASQTPTLPPIVLSSHPSKKKGFSAPDRLKYKKPSNFW